MATGKETLTLNGHTQEVRSVAFRLDGKRIVSCSGNQGQLSEIKVWDATTGQPIHTLTGHTGVILSVAFSPDGLRIASAGSDKTVKLWDAATGEEIHALKGHEHLVPSVVFTPDGKRIVAGDGHNLHLLLGDLLDSDYPGELKVWDAATGQETLTLKGHSAPIICLAISKDGTQIASASFDGTIKLWYAPRVGSR